MRSLRAHLEASGITAGPLFHPVDRHDRMGAREAAVTPHVAQNQHERRTSAIDERTTRHEGYGISQRKRKRVEEIFGWIKTIAWLRKTRHRVPKRNSRMSSCGNCRTRKPGS